MIKAGEISEIIKRQLAGYEPEVDLQEVGRVIEVGDGIARIYGLEKAMAEIVSGRSSLAQIALNARFSSQTSFTRAFSRATG